MRKIYIIEKTEVNLGKPDKPKVSNIFALQDLKSALKYCIDKEEKFDFTNLPFPLISTRHKIIITPVVEDIKDYENNQDKYVVEVISTIDKMKQLYKSLIKDLDDGKRFF